MYSILSDKVVNKIRDEVEKIKVEYHIVNPIVKNDIFEILDRVCVVLRYPLEDDEDANGIHVERWIKGEKKHVVFINTSNYIEKQVYTAAHELGHVWEIDNKVLSTIDEVIDPEAIINRFAAELLMPHELFVKFFVTACGEEIIRRGSIEENDLTKIIAFLMNTFMVPYKAIVYRLEEVGFIDTISREKLEEVEKLNAELLHDYIKMENYYNIFKTDSQKSMSELYGMLKIAEQKELIPITKIERIREKFSYDAIVPVLYDNQEEITIINIPEERLL